jgi:hypothetical protein
LAATPDASLRRPEQLPHNPTDVRPVACANLRNERTDLAIDFTEFVLRSRQYSTMNAVMFPASSRLTDTFVGSGNDSRNCFTFQQSLSMVIDANPR